MFKLNLKTVSTLALGIMMSASVAFAQPATPPPGHSPRFHEKMLNVKKMRMIELLDLSEEKADKFIVKYGAAEKRIMEAGKMVDSVTKELRDLMKKDKASESEIKAKTDKFLQYQDEMNKAITAKFTSIRSVLSEQEFAKFIIAETRFQEEMRQMLIDRHGMKKDLKKMMKDRKNRPDCDSNDSPKNKKQGMKKGDKHEDHSHCLPDMLPPPDEEMPMPPMPEGEMDRM